MVGVGGWLVGLFVGREGETLTAGEAVVGAETRLGNADCD